MSPEVPATKLLRTRRDVPWFDGAAALLGVVLLGLVLYPLSRVLQRAFLPDGSLDLSAFATAATQAELPVVVGHTIMVVVVSAVVALVIGSGLAYLHERTDARMRVLGDVLPMVPFLIPPIAGSIGWIILLSPRAGFLNVWIRDALSLIGIEYGTGRTPAGPLDIYSWYGIVFVYAVYMVPFVFLVVSAALRNFDPSLEEQSRVCGGSRFRTMRKVVLPAIRPAMAGASLLLVWFGLALYSVPATIGPGAGIEILSVRIVNLLRFTSPPQTEVAVVLSLIVLGLLALTWYGQRKVVRGNTHLRIGGKGQRSTPVELGRWRWPLRLLVIAYLLVTTLLPFLALLVVALNGFWNPVIDPSAWSLRAFQRMVSDGVTTDALQNSATLAVVGATLAMLLAATVAIYVDRSRGPLAKMVDASIKLPAAISGLVLGVGILLAFAGPPFRLAGTLLILLIAYVTVFMPQASVMADSAVAQIGGELSEASYISGAGPGRTFRKVHLPLMAPGLAVGWAMLFVFMFGDLNVSPLLASSRNNVVGMRILQIYQGESFAQLAVLATVLTMISAVVVGVVFAISRRTGTARANVGGVG